MGDWITDEEMDRIHEFASTPRYCREPQQLVPDGGMDDEAAAENEDDATAEAEGD